MKQQFCGNHYRITLLTQRLIRLEYSQEDYFEDRPTNVVINRQLDVPDFHVLEDDEKLEIITPYIHLHYNKGEFSSDNLFVDVRKKLGGSPNRWSYGQQYATLKGTTRTLDNADGAVELGEGIISREGFAVLDDSDSFLLETDEELMSRPGKEKDLYLFAYGNDYYAAITDYFRLTGFPPLLPRYALGNWWSRFWPYSEGSYLKLMERFQEEEMPLSVSVIDMDWHRTGDVPDRFGSGWTGYSWNRALFPEPRRFLESLHNMGLVVTLNVHPADGIRAFEDAYPIVAEHLGLNQTDEEPAIFDMNDPQFREVYFNDVHHPLEEQGVDFWWIDWQQGTHGKIDPLWLLNHYHYKDISRNGQQGIILSRYAGPGSHRYPIGFSGDTVISWKSLQFQPYFTSTATNIGYSWWSHDIGGHMLGNYDEDLTSRWFQFGVFSPINRLHSSNSPFSSKEPWVYSIETHHILKKYLQLRHQLIPYLYTMNVVTHTKGIALMRPMYYDYPEITSAYNVPNQYLFGSQLMVAPITTKVNQTYKVASTEVWFPEGIWYDFFTDSKYEGNTTIDVYRERDGIPVFAKEGAIIPLDHRPPITGVNLPELLDWHVFPGKSNSFKLIEDSGRKRAITTVELDWKKRTLNLSVDDSDKILPINRKHRVILHTYEVDDTWYDNDSQVIFLGKRNRQVKHTRLEKVQHRLQIAEIDFETKHYILDQLSANHSLHHLLPRLNKCDDVLRGQLTELLYSDE